MRVFMTLCLIFGLASCAGYRFQEKDNPFSQYGVKSITVPMFYNHSNFSDISSPMTREIYQMLSGFNGLELRSGNKKADAVLIGIIASPDKIKESMKGQNFRSAKNAENGNVGENRGDFYIPSTTELSTSLQLILIKNPSDKEIELLRTSFGRFAVGSKIILNESISLKGSYTRELFGPEASDVIDTQNRSAAKNTILEMSQTAAQNFKDMILYAF